MLLILNLSWRLMQCQLRRGKSFICWHLFVLVVVDEARFAMGNVGFRVGRKRDAGTPHSCFIQGSLPRWKWAVLPRISTEMSMLWRP